MKDQKTNTTIGVFVAAFFHPDYTVGFGVDQSILVAPNPASLAVIFEQTNSARGLYRRSGISPCPEGLVVV